MAFAITFGSVSCRKQGTAEVIMAMHAMGDLKTFRIEYVSGSSSVTGEYSCPGRVHQIARVNGHEEEEIVIDGTSFYRDAPDGHWVRESRKSELMPACGAILGAAIGGSLGAMGTFVSGKSGEFKYMGQGTVSGETCDTWGIPMENFSVPHTGQYQDPTPHWAAIVCIQRSNHRILQTKLQDGKVLRFYDFNQTITIAEPELPHTSSQKQ